MILTSFKFIIFFAAVLILYYVMPKKAQWMLLLIASIFFYAAASPKLLLYVFASTLITYSAAMLMGSVSRKQKEYIAQNDLNKEQKLQFKEKCRKKRFAICSIGVILNIGILCFVKYFNFFAGTILALAGKNFTALDIIVPLGISFYTFQSTGYVIDVCREVSEPEKNPLKYMLFVIFFPTILQGPICKYETLGPALISEHKFCYDRVKSGLLRMVWGFFKKLVIADRAAILVDTVFGDSYFSGDYVGAYIAVAAVMYAIQLYADFSGYMDIAIGAAEALDITLTENFDCPYFSRSVAEFWRRWHISLGAWFRDYLFYSVIRTSVCQKIAKNKKLPKYIKTKIPTVIGLAVVWFVMGFWHGASWRYVFYGVYYGAIIIFSTLMEPVYNKIISALKIDTQRFDYKLFQTLRTFFIVCIGYIFFRGYSLRSSFEMVKSMFTDYNPWILFDDSLLQLGIDSKNMNILLLSVLILFCVSLANQNKIIVREKLAEQNMFFQGICYITGILFIIIFGIYGFGYDAASFIYFGF